MPYPGLVGLRIASGQQVHGPLGAHPQLRPRHGHAFIGQGGAGQLPAPVDLPHHAVIRDEHVVEEDLVEHRVAGDLPQRTRVDAGRRHVDQEVRDPAVLGVPIGASQADPPVSLAGLGRPHLLTGQRPSAVDPDGTGGQGRKVRTRARLAEQLAPRDVTEQRGQHETFPLLRRAVLDDGGHRPRADGQIGAAEPCSRQLLVNHQLLDRTRVEAERSRPVRRQVARLRQSGSLLIGGKPRDHVHLRPRGGANLGIGSVEVDLGCAALTGSGPSRQPGGRLLRSAGEGRHRDPQCDRSPEIQVRVVLEGESDPTEHLDAVLRHSHGPVESHRGSNVGRVARFLDRHVRPQGGADIPRDG